MEILEAHEIILNVQKQPKKVLFGLDQSIEHLMLAILTLVPYLGARGKTCLGQPHVFLQDVPGVGKTALIRAFANAIEAESTFFQGDPDTTPREIVGSEIYASALVKFFEVRGPIFTHFFLADEINRNPPKAVAPLLAAMEERVVTLSKTDIENEIVRSMEYPLYPVPDSTDDLFFLTLATANPIETEGTYPMSEAVIDRFPLSFSLGYPPREEEKRIRLENIIDEEIRPVTDLRTILQIARMIVDRIGLGDNVSEYIQRILENSRPDHEDRKTARQSLVKDVDMYIEEGGGISPRTNYHLEAVSRTRAFMRGSDHIAVEDVKYSTPLVLSHKLRLSYEANAKGVSAKDMVLRILEGTEVPPS